MPRITQLNIADFIGKPIYLAKGSHASAGAIKSVQLLEINCHYISPFDGTEVISSGKDWFKVKHLVNGAIVVHSMHDAGIITNDYNKHQTFSLREEAVRYVHSLGLEAYEY